MLGIENFQLEWPALDVIAVRLKHLHVVPGAVYILDIPKV